MTRYVIDAAAAIEIARADRPLDGAHSLVAPSLLRSQVLSTLYRAVRSDQLSRQEGQLLLNRVTELKIRLLGDRVSRGTAWKIAEELGFDDTADAEYLAVTRLQADALIALDPQLAERARGTVPLASIHELYAHRATR
ncbi:MAG TPA: type II toxin-antitoxin system VapC family toxin [Pseudolysinimonas sp.]